MDTAYRTHPVHTFPWLRLESGYHALVEYIATAVGRSGATTRVVIDGFSGVRWMPLMDALVDQLRRSGLEPRCFSTGVCFRPELDLKHMLQPLLTDDPVFGRLFRGHLSEMWEPA